MKLISSVNEMRKAENDAMEMSILGIILMENAAIATLKHLNGFKNVRIFCGKGNNAGDGFCIARHLFNKGIDVEIILVTKPSFEGDTLINYNAVKNMGVKITPFSDIKEKKVDLIIDAIFGTGLNKEVSGFYKDAIFYINEQDSYKISIDIPSGICADTGNVLGCAVKADKTITFGMYKYAHFLYDGKSYCGKVILEDIQIPKSLLTNIKTFVFDEYDAFKLLPIRSDNSHKGTFGRLLVIGGSINMPGAPLLCANSSLRSGCGVTVLALPKSAAAKILPSELIVYSLSENDETISKKAIDEIKNELNISSAVAIGCGMGVSEDVLDIVSYVLNNTYNPVLLDADGINVLEGNLDILKNAKAKNIILTPHPKEFSRISGKSVKEILKNPILHAKDFATNNNVTLLLKGAHTVIASPNGEAFISPFANSALSKAGSGDVLSGIISSFLSQGLPPIDSCILGVTIHGLCGEIAKQKLSAYSTISGDLINLIPNAILYLQNQGVN